jgi:two-component system LytT family response regulator
MRVAIIDDEPLAREGLRLMLDAHPNVEIAGEAGNGRDGLALVRDTRPELALVDVRMPEMTGLEMVAALPIEHAPAIVFVTAFDDHAVRAFELHALDYLVKPVSESRLATAIARARDHLARRMSADELDQLRARLAICEPAREPLAIRDGQRIVYVPVETIDWACAASYYVEIHAAGRQYLHRETMQRLAATLDPDRFVRIHRSCLVNRDRIREVRRRGRGAIVVLSDGTSHELARSYWPSFKLAHTP